MTQRWEEVLDRQLDLSSALGDPKSRTAIAADGYASSLIANREAWPYDDGPGALTRDLPERLSAMVFNADPVYVDPDMQTVWEGAIEGFKPEPLAPTDLITPAGFLVFARPLYMTDIRGNRTSFRAILWHPNDIILHGPGPAEHVPEGTPPKPGDHIAPVVEQIDDRTFKTGGIVFAMFHDPADADDYDIPELRMRGLMVGHVMPWMWGEDWGDMGSQFGVIKPVQALWRLMLQTIADRGAYRASGKFRKRWERARWPEKHVTVVRLRRPRHESERDEPSTVNWTHRWLVGGHWRWQWYANDQVTVCGHRYDDGRICDKAGGVHRQIWISPFVKGPEELPLVPNKVRVFELVR